MCCAAGSIKARGVGSTQRALDHCLRSRLEEGAAHSPEKPGSGSCLRIAFRSLPVRRALSVPGYKGGARFLSKTESPGTIHSPCPSLGTLSSPRKMPAGLTSSSLPNAS